MGVPARVNRVAVPVAGLLLLACLAGLAVVRDLRANVVPFVLLYGAAYLVFGAVVWWAARARESCLALPAIIVFAVLFRVTMLFTTPPTLSDDVYRYIWDGRLMNAGVNPYSYIVESPELDWLDTPQRALVNHSWMASPYLPVAQLYFAAIGALAPGSPLAFQVAATVLDLLTGVIVIDLLRRLGLPRSLAMIYLWNPLVIVEFAHGAHVDSLMICLMVASLWALVAHRSRVASAVALALATLTKGIPALLLPVLLPCWRWKGIAAYAGVVATLCIPFILGTGLGLTGPLDGVGLLGPLRIYATRWNYNGGLYHWLEVAVSQYPAAGAVPPEVVGKTPILIAKAIAALGMCLVLLFAWRKALRCAGDVCMLHTALLPLGGYLLLTTTVHPWYVALVIPLLPFLLGTSDEAPRSARFLAPWLAFAGLVVLSYLTYLDPANLREFEVVRLAQYLPLFLLLAWAARPAIGAAATSARG